MENLWIFGVNLLAAAGLMVIGWLISLANKNVTIADSFWGLGFILIAWLTFFAADGYFARKLILSLLVTAWGVRLFIHMSLRSWGKGEDPRYAEWRKKHGENFWIVSLFKVFLIQALFQWIISLGVQYGQLSAVPANLTWLDFLGMGIWAAGFVIETAADRQLVRFNADPANKGKVMDQKLWRYSRHPNYFGEALVWWGLFLIVLAVPGGVWTIVSPMVITYTLLRITGVTLMEQTEFSENPEYQAYIRKTSAFIPWPPKK
ncbi:MAG: DUF1295 domain-containing protein [Desulfobacterales bacterium]|nr:DUF1295 domain-containing protein [Desulfobacterales bacterium]